jgi:hypothetical protein
MDRETALRKIQKCLKLSASSEPHEAARALRHAKALMAQFDVDNPELLAGGVTEDMAPSRATKTPPSYESRLARTVADSLGCGMLFVQGFARLKIGGSYTFIGAGGAAEVARYMFVVLARKLQASRIEYVNTRLTRYKKNKVAAADEFCAGWVQAVDRSVSPALPDERRRASLEAYMGRTYPDLGEVTPRRRELANTTRAVDHRVNGFIAGTQAHVNPGIGSDQVAQGALTLDTK